MTRVAIHMRPMILPHINGTPENENMHEVDVWLYLRNGIAEIIFEAVTDSKRDAEQLITELQEAFKGASIIVEETK